jgi:23S rRNA (adenine2030-N6)-methyltransferase
MLAYRHAFHAGNHADVLKQLALFLCLRQMGKKEKGFLYVDTHAGAGSYLLEEGYAAQNREWESGIARVRAAAGKQDATGSRGPVPEPIPEYLELLAAIEPPGSPGFFPGTPVLASYLLRPQDRVVCCELHPTDYQLLAERFAGDKQVHVRKEDGFSALKSLLPPPTRRGLVFIDPSYELGQDYDLVIKTLVQSHKRFPTGCFAVWYPLLEREEALDLPGMLRSACDAPWLDLELRVRGNLPGERGMAGSGLFVLNPPYTLEDGMRTSLPWLGDVMGLDGGAKAEIRTSVDTSA